MPRHRGTYNPENHEAYELSRSRIENFVKCPACFYLTQVKGIKFPSIPGFNINEATDILLKRDFDKYRGAKTTHDFLINLGMAHLIPFEHPDFELWTQSMHFGAQGRMHFIHEASNLKVGGGLDVTANLDNFRRYVSRPHAFNPVKFTNLWTENMDDYIIGINQYPVGLP